MPGTLRVALVQFNPVVGDIAGNTQKIIDYLHQYDHRADLVVFPELALTGYSPEDLVHVPSFKAAVLNAREKIIAATANLRATCIVPLPMPDMGAVIYNAAHVFAGGAVIATINKHHLPNYRVFDEKRIFTAGALHQPYITVNGYKIGLVICEDFWFENVIADRAAHGAELIISVNASPIEEDKFARRVQTAEMRVRECGLPLIYLNNTGGQDEVVFDGATFVLDHTGHMVSCAPAFRDDVRIITFRRTNEGVRVDGDVVTPYPDRLTTLYLGAMSGLRDYVDKNGFAGVILGLSGGIDSALSAAIAVDALGANRVRAVMMPSPYTAQMSLDDAAAIAKNLGIDYTTVPINGIMTAYETALPDMCPLAHENMQSRARGAILMAQSNTNGFMVLTTGNKSENAVGYATLYGDMCGGYNAIKDLYKMDIYALTRFRNRTRPDGALGPAVADIIPDRVITRPPSAELRDNQTDQDSLPPYDILDRILRGLVDMNQSPDDLVATGLDRATIDRVLKLLRKTEYKRRQAAPGAKLSSRAFGRDWRMPITNKFMD